MREQAGPLLRRFGVVRRKMGIAQRPGGRCAPAGSARRALHRVGRVGHNAQLQRQLQLLLVTAAAAAARAAQRIPRGLELCGGVRQRRAVRVARKLHVLRLDHSPEGQLQVPEQIVVRRQVRVAAAGRRACQP